MPTARDDRPIRTTIRTMPPGAALVLLLLGACAAPGTIPDAAQEPAEFARTASEIKLALIEAADVDAAAIGVSVSEESVTISGFVASEAEREAALTIASETARVRSADLDIVDELDVRD